MSVASAAPGRTSLRERARAIPQPLVVAGSLVALVAFSLWLRSTALHAPFWIDEGLSVGISSFGFTEIPGVLRQDGSPPLYYLLLHVWMQVFSDGQATTHALSLGFALLTIPVGWWAGWSLFGMRAGLFTALLFALNPFLTYYAQETRMYALVVLLSLTTAALFLHAFAWRRPWAIWAFGLSLAALVYTHNWGLFLGAGSVIAFWWCLRRSPDRRGLLLDAAKGYGLTAVLYLPWVPSLLFQAANTGAPWSERPEVADVFGPIAGILGGQEVPLALLLAGGAGLATLGRLPAPGSVPAGLAANPRRVAMQALIALPVAALVLAWTASQVSPAFTGRYFAAFVGPTLLLAGAGLAYAGRLGIVALAIVLVLWWDPRTGQINAKSNVRAVAADVRYSLQPGDLVVSVHPEQMPLLRYYLSPGLRYATALGPAADPRVFDWRDAQEKLQAARPKATLDTLLPTMREGQTLVLVLPIIRTGRWGAPWTSLVRKRSAQWQRVADRDPRLLRLSAVPRFGNKRLPRGVRVVLYRYRGPDATTQPPAEGTRPSVEAIVAGSR